MKTKNRILIFDIETTPIVAYVWGLWEQDVIRVKEDWRILSFSYKWLGEKEIHFVRAQHDDKSACRQLHKLFDQADIIVAHNGNRFDVPKVQARFLVHGLPPPTPFKAVDTKLVARKHFGFNSNKLDTLGEVLGEGRKYQHEGFDLWLGCMAGNEKSWRTMEKYNKRDVLLLERLYLRMMPYMTTYPKLHPQASCQHCGSEDVQFRGMYPAKREARRFVCKNCGVWGHIFINSKKKGGR